MNKKQARSDGRGKGLMIKIKLTGAQWEIVKTALVEHEETIKDMVDDSHNYWTERDYKTFQRACYQIWNPEEDKLKKIKKILEKA
tara:strand:- start:56 stop:310 length:255 start_codon:yes stop_codon:yes gene_type:complete